MNNKNNKYYVYIYLDPRKNGNYNYDEYHFEYEPFYVGKGCGDRYKQHLYNSRSETNKQKYIRIKQIKEEYGKPVILKIQDNMLQKDAIELEIKIINLIGTLKNNGILLNIIDKIGYPVSRKGRIVSEITRQRISQSKKGTKWGHHTQETKKIMSDKKKGIKFSVEHKKNLSIKRKLRITTQETKNKIRKSSKGKINIKKYILINSDGIEYITTNGLTLFCEQHNLNRPNLLKILKGERKTSKGWTIKNYKE